MFTLHIIYYQKSTVMQNENQPKPPQPPEGGGRLRWYEWIIVPVVTGASALT
jgi:hypothetical protein